MGSPATGTALVLLVAFVLPGFVTVLLQERTFKSADDPTPFDRLLRAVYYSVWCYVLLAGVALIFGLDRAWAQSFFERHDGNPAGLVFLAALLILAPAGVVWLSTLIWQESGRNEWALDKLHMNARHQRPTSWDFWFRKGIKTHLRIIYADGRSVWGYYGDRSFASYAKDGLDLFLEAVYREKTLRPAEATSEPPRPWFGKLKPKCRGAWVKVDDAVCIELYDFHDARKPETPGARTPETAGSGTGGAASAPQPPPAPSSAPASPAGD
jgi:hypothetical protein